MGAVYLAEDPLLKRRVAIKVTHAGGTAEQEQGLLRFRREAEISAHLNHPNVITVFDVGEDPAAGAFIAMEFVDGESLAAMIRSDHLSLEARLKVLLQAARALGAAHAAGIIHRDIKPQNLMVGLDGRVKLMDFGIARGEESSLTATGAILGTPSYIAPEHVSGAPPSQSTDCWAFSVMAFELLTGRLPYPGESLSRILYRIAHEPPAIPEGMDPALRAIFERAFAKDPAARYPDLKAFMKALIEVSPLQPAVQFALLSALKAEEAVGEGGTLVAAEAAARASKLLKRLEGARLILVLAVAAAATVIAVGVTVSFRLLRVAPPPPPRILNVTSNPEGAMVFVDGVLIGVTPRPRAVIQTGARRLRVEKKGYAPLDHDLAAEERDVRLDLKALPGERISPPVVTEAAEPGGVAPLVGSAPPGSKVTRAESQRGKVSERGPAPAVARKPKPKAKGEGGEGGFWGKVGQGFKRLGEGIRDVGKDIKEGVSGDSDKEK